MSVVYEESGGRALPVHTQHHPQPAGPVALAGPTCDSADILYDKTDYHLPLALAAGDHLDILAAGAYTTTYASIEASTASLPNRVLRLNGPREE